LSYEVKREVVKSWGSCKTSALQELPLKKSSFTGFRPWNCQSFCKTNRVLQEAQLL